MTRSPASTTGHDAKRSTNLGVLSRRHATQATTEEKEPLLRRVDLKENVCPPHDKVEYSDGESYVSCDSHRSSRHASPVSLRRFPAKSSSKFPRQSIRASSSVRPVRPPISFSLELGSPEAEPQHAATIAAEPDSRPVPLSTDAASVTDAHYTGSRETSKVAQYALETPDDTEFCLKCTAARAETEYPERTRALLDRLYCSGCEGKHGVLLFSADQRQKDDSQRVCIGYEGWLKPCPHKTMSIGDQMDIHHNNGSTGKRDVRPESCREGDCARFSKLRTRYNFLGAGGNFLTSWTADVPITNEHTAKQDVMDALSRLLLSSPELFCPHVQASPARFCSVASVTHAHGPRSFPYEYRIDCYSCHQSVRFNAPKPGAATVEVSGLRGAFIVPPRNKWPSQWNWVTQLDPKSFNLEQDAESKHILWCDGGSSCATNYGRLRYSALLHDALPSISAIKVAVIKDFEGDFVVRHIDHLAAKKQNYEI